MYIHLLDFKNGEEENLNTGFSLEGLVFELFVPSSSSGLQWGKCANFLSELSKCLRELYGDGVCNSDFSRVCLAFLHEYAMEYTVCICKTRSFSELPSAHRKMLCQTEGTQETDLCSNPNIKSMVSYTTWFWYLSSWFDWTQAEQQQVSVSSPTGDADGLRARLAMKLVLFEKV